MIYSITSSARATSGPGIVRPIAFAVLKPVLGRLEAEPASIDEALGKPQLIEARRAKGGYPFVMQLRL